MGSFGSNHTGFFKNFFDPLGIIPGKKGFLGLGERKENDAPKPAAAAAPPSVMSDSANAEDEEKLKRIGRAALVTGSSRGVLTEANTSTKQLFGVQ